MDSFLQDLRYSLRKLVRAPAFTIVAVFTLALAIGATTAVFSLVDGVLLKSLPFRDPDRLVRVQSLNGQTPSSVSQPDFLDYRAQSHTVSPMAAFATGSANLTAAGAEPMRIQLARVGAVWFDLLGVRPQFGRAFRDDEEKAGAARVAVLSQSIWRSRFGADRKVLGTSIDIDGKPVTVVGVAPPRWNYPEEADLWMPLVFEGWEAQPDNRGGHWLRLVGRLAPHVAVEQAGRELAKIADGLAKQYPATNTRYSAGVTPLLEALVGPVRPALLALLGAVVFVLLIACANVANLMLVRAGAREGEIAVRMALGAGSWRLARQLVIESVMLSLVAAALGAVLASWAVDAVVAFGPKGIPRLDLVAVDGRALAFGIAIAAVGAGSGTRCHRPDPRYPHRRGDGAGGRPARRCGSAHEELPAAGRDRPGNPHRPCGHVLGESPRGQVQVPSPAAGLRRPDGRAPEATAGGAGSRHHLQGAVHRQRFRVQLRSGGTASARAGNGADRPGPSGDARVLPGPRYPPLARAAVR